MKPVCRSIVFASARLFIAVAPFRAIDLPSKMKHLINIACILLWSAAISAGSACSISPYNALLFLFAYPPAEGYRSAHYPQPPVTVTTAVTTTQPENRKRVANLHPRLKNEQIEPEASRLIFSQHVGPIPQHYRLSTSSMRAELKTLKLSPT